MTGLPTVFWDFDGTLAFRRGMWSSCLWQAVNTADAAGSVKQEAIAAGLQSGFPWHTPDVGHPHLTSSSEWWAALAPVLRKALAASGVEPDTINAALELVPAIYTNPTYWNVFDDAFPTLEKLRDMGWRHIILSNHVPELPQLVSDLGFDDLVSAVYSSAHIGWEKPNLRAFEYALAAANHPQHCFMVGDNLVADIQGALSANIPSVLVRSEAGSAPTGLEVIFDVIPDLRKSITKTRVKRT